MSLQKTVFPLVLGLTLAASTPAAAAEWDNTFSSDRVAAYVNAQMKSVAVVAAGERNRDLEQAASALTSALRRSGKTDLVMDDRGLGNVTRLDDAAIVARCAKLPVTTVAVVRIFEGEKSAPPTTVVTFYDKQSEVTAALSAKRGEPLDAPTAGSAGEGVSNDAASAVTSLTKNISGTQAQAREKFEKEAVWFEDMVAVDGSSGAVVSSWSNVYQGKYKKPLGGAEFYEVVGRPDLAEQYRSSDAVRSAFIVPGGAIALLGLVAMTASPFALLIGDDVATDDTKMTVMLGGLIGGGGVALAGALVGSVGAMVNPHPVKPTEARELADNFNKKLARDLGLSEQE
jgi:hypothetical protein